MQTKEHLLFYILVKNLRLQYNDKKFFTSLSILVKNSRITTGQAALFDKLIHKYTNQLKNTNLSLGEMLALPWQIEVVTTSSDFTSARVSLKDGDIILRVPTNKQFINKLESIRNCDFVWNNTRREYHAPFSTGSLKLIYRLLPNYFKEIRYCNTLHQMIDSVSLVGENLIWSPTLVKFNNAYFVIAANQVLGELIDNIELNAEPKTLYKLSQLGITIDKNITNNDPFLEFAAEFATDVEISDLGLLVGWIKQLDIPQVLLGKGVHSAFEKTRTFFKNFIKRLDEESIFYRTIHTGFRRDPKQKELPILIQYHSNEIAKFCSTSAIGKCIFVKNSTPIEVE